jgi:uroporphyrinogen-III synthase
MPANPLRGIGVLVTRPENQSLGLCRLLEAQGADSYRLPAVDILEHAAGRERLKALGNLADFDLVIFVSANAVRFGAQVLSQRRDLTLAAIGPATARALNHAGYRVGVVPEHGFDSQSLLALPQLAHLHGSRVLLIQGTGGRNLLAPELAKRGAAVEVVEVYERIQARPSVSAVTQIESFFAGGQIQLITATSLQIAVSLWSLAPASLQNYFAAGVWIVPSERVAAGVREFARHAAIVTAGSAEDQDVLRAALSWRATLSGA